MCLYYGVRARCGATVAFPPKPENIDVFVLLDGTGSMAGSTTALDDAMRRIDARLRAGGNTVGWGAGYYRENSFVDAPRGYFRLSRIRVGSVPSIAEVHFNSGGTDTAEPATLGLDGLLGVAHAPYSAAGEDAGFRGAGTHKVVLLVTDAPIKESSEYPSIHDVLGRLNAADVDVVALQMLTDNEPEPARADLRRVVRGTGALATAQVDCDGEAGLSEWDVAPGAPLMCPLYPYESSAAWDMEAFADGLLAMVRAGR
jgi:hypothetical protein